MVKISEEEIRTNLDRSLESFNQQNKFGLVVYTAILGNFDHLNEVKNPSPNIHYVCFTDRKDLHSKTWEIIHCINLNEDPRLVAKIFKVFPHKIFKNARQSLWIDGNYSINSNHAKFFDSYSCVKNIQFYKHSIRNCIFDEARYIQKEKPEFNPIIVKEQMNRYREAGMPELNGLINGAIILRNHQNGLLHKLMDDWWFEIYNYSIRDQLSFNYVNWKNGSPAEYFSEEITNFLYFTFKPHLNSTKSEALLAIKIFIKSLLGKIILYVKHQR